MTVYQAFCAMKNFTIDQREKKMKKSAADQEYRYWLARYAVYFWQSGLHNLRIQQNLIHEIDQDYSKKKTLQVFETLKKYA
jgi:hypothetical protein